MISSLAPSLCIALALAARGEAPPAADTPVTVNDVMRLKAVTAAVISPDGATIAYTVSVPRDPLKEKDGAAVTELWVATQGTPPRPFVRGDGGVGQVAFAPDGQSITFLSKRANDKFRALYAIALAGGEARKLFEFENDVTDYALHPVFHRLAFLAAPAPAKEKKEWQDKGFTQEVYEEDWSAAKLHTFDFDAPGAKPKAFDLKGHASEVHFSGDGRFLLVAVAPTPLTDDSYMNKKLHVIDLDAGQDVATVDHAGKLGAATISPDGKLLAFIGALDEHDPQAGRLEVAHALGGVTRELLPDLQGHFTGCAFADNKTLVYVADRGCQTVLGRIGVDGSGNQELLAEKGFAITACSVSKDGKKAALIAQGVNFPPELFRYELGGAKTRVTTLNPDLAQRKFGDQEVVQWTARDGLDLEGILIHPLGHKAGSAATTSYPLIVVVHGGPESHNRDGWLTSYSNPGQVAAGKGYAVFYPNYRASTGRGVAFSMLDHKDPAGKEFDDLVDGVDALVKSGLVDRSKVGITGGSYGGYATGWCCTKYSDRFAAGVMGFGVSDLLSMAGVNDIPTEHYLVHHRVHPWEDWNLFLERSPIFHAKEGKTPLLILAGKADTRVPPSQSLELYRYLKTAGNPAVRLVLYAGEGHGNSRAASRLDYSLRMMQWFDHYLKGNGGAPPPQRLDYAGLTK